MRSILFAALLLGLAGAAGAAVTIDPFKPNEVAFPPSEARFVRFVIHASANGQACIDELEVYGPEGARNLALAAGGAVASASSCLAGYPIHQIPHLNDGLYGNDHSWIAASDGEEWAQIELPALTRVNRVVFSRDRAGKYRDRLPAFFEVRLSPDGKAWKTVATVKVPALLAGAAAARPLPDPLTYDALLNYAFLCERDTWEAMTPDDHLSPLRVERPALPGGKPYWGALARMASVSRVLRQMADLAERLSGRGLDVAAERRQLAELRRRQAALPAGDERAAAEETLYLDARLAKRRLFLRDPDLAPLQKILFVKRHPYRPSHNYSDILDSQFRPGGGVCVLEIPRRAGRLEPEAGKVTVLFDASAGIARDAVADFDGRRIYFAYRPTPPAGQEAFWHLMVVNADVSAGAAPGNLFAGAAPANRTGLKQLTDGPFHDYYPCPLPDGGLAFISTRCRSRFLCWRPQAFVLFRMGPGGEGMSPLSFANLSEWAPSVTRDGRILWTRSEYLDKGADFGHTLWAIHPDGTHPTLVFGNDTTNCYVNAHEMPGTGEMCCTLIAHGGDLNGPVALIDLRDGPFAPDAITNITPDVRPHYHMDWAQRECFRDPIPISRDLVLASHAPADRFGLYVLDRYGNRELLSLDPEVGSMCPTPLRSVARPPVLAHAQPAAGGEMGVFTVADVYQGVEPAVRRGTAKYIRVCEEVRSGLEQRPDGSFRADYDPFQDFYASPTHKVTGPYGWPSYVAKASLGLAPVEADGSASFLAPAGKVLYFELLDGAFNELQRMRSVVQLQPGESRSCIGCHESRNSAPPTRLSLAMRRPPSRLDLPPWGAVPYSYEKVVQPVLDARCVSCHGRNDARRLDLSGTLDAERVPASYRTLITQGWVNYFDYTWGREHNLAAPLTFGTVKSKLWQVLDAGHHGVKLTPDETRALKCWIDLNCPLWPDYKLRQTRTAGR